MRKRGGRESSEKGKWKEGERKRAQRGWGGEERKESRVREQIKERGGTGTDDRLEEGRRLGRVRSRRESYRNERQ